MLSRAQASILFILLLCAVLSCVAALAFTILHTWSLKQSLAAFVTLWFRHWGVSFLIIAPTAALAFPRLKRFTDALVRR